MLSLKDALTFRIEHDATWIDSALSGSAALIASEDGTTSLCPLVSNAKVVTWAAPGEIVAFRSHPAKTLLALACAENGKLLVMDFNGGVVFEEEAPVVPPNSPDWLVAGYMDVCFDASGEHLWTIAPFSGNTFEVQLRKTGRWTVEQRMVLKDPFEGSTAFFDPTPEANRVALSLGDGQGGLNVYWVEPKGNAIRCTEQRALSDSPTLAFSPEGKELLALDGVMGGIRKFSYPKLQMLGECGSPFGENDAARMICYVNTSCAVVMSDSNRIGVVDTAQMVLLQELVLEGHEPRSVSETPDNAKLYTDIFSLGRTTNHVLLACPPTGRGKEPEDSSTLIVCLPSQYVLGQSSG